MNFSLRNRIAFFYIVATALLTVLLFTTVYYVVSDTVYDHLDSDLDSEAAEIFNNLVILQNDIIFANPFEWTEREHGQVEVNPVFIQITDSRGAVLKKTPNLGKVKLRVDTLLLSKHYLSTTLSGSPTRQMQTPIQNPTGKVLGFIIISIPLEESALVLENLRWVLLIAFPLVLLLLFLISRFIAGKSISPINKVILTAQHITRENINERIELPPHKDEIFKLTSTVNKLLDRLEDAVLREKQFTSDASHELRTPLAVIKGTLEVLIRKPREVEQYENKIKYCIGEVDRMSGLVEQLLMLARYESGKIKPLISEINVNALLSSVISRNKELIRKKKIEINISGSDGIIVCADQSMLEVILDNLLSNAVKYSSERSVIDFVAEKKDTGIILTLKDYGIGMTPDQSSRIFDRFYRADESRNSDVHGNGLGLSIVKKLSDLQGLKITLVSKPSEGSAFSILFNG